MKLLFIGFSEQNANLLSFLIQQNFSHIDCVYIERHLTQDLKFSLPIIPSQHQDAQGFIINLDGTGMLSYQSRHKDSLLKYTKQLPTLLTTRMAIEPWQESLGQAHIFYLQSPYNKDSMLSILKDLLAYQQTSTPSPSITPVSKPQAMVSNNPATNPSDHTPNLSVAQNSPSTPQTDKKQPLFDNVLTQAPNNGEQTIIKNVLSQHFNAVYNTTLIKEFSKLFFQNQPFILRASRYHILVDGNNNLAISTNIARMIDYFTVAKNHEQFSSSMTVEVLDQAQYLAQAQELEQLGAKKYALNTLLWQIYHAILPEHIQTQARNLQLKVKFMPNFASLDDTPSYTQAVISSCLSLPKTLDELHIIFGEIKPENINRIFLLAVLSRIADLDVLATPRADNQISINQILKTQHKEQKNAGVNKATKTGFFRRLLQKLSL